MGRVVSCWSGKTGIQLPPCHHRGPCCVLLVWEDGHSVTSSSPNKSFPLQRKSKTKLVYLWPSCSPGGVIVLAPLSQGELTPHLRQTGSTSCSSNATEPLSDFLLFTNLMCIFAFEPHNCQGPWPSQKLFQFQIVRGRGSGWAQPGARSSIADTTGVVDPESQSWAGVPAPPFLAV